MHALITGSSTGLGFAFAKILLKKEYDITLLSSNNSKLEYARSILQNKAKSNLINILNIDLSTIKDFKENIDVAGIDLLIINAGVTNVRLISEYKNLHDLDYEININLLGAIRTFHYFSKFLNKNAHIIFISSGFSFIGPAGYSLYAASKAGLNVFVDSLRRENKQYTFHIAYPGDIDTPMYRQELQNMPKWMAGAKSRSNIMKPETAASKILLKALNKNQRYIYISNDVRLLCFLKRFLPSLAFDKVIDLILPRP